MGYFKCINKADIKKMIELLYLEGYVSENDLGDIYFAQYPEAVKDLNVLLNNNGYMGEVKSIGYCEDGIVIYGVYDEEKIEYEDVYEHLKKEWRKQN